MKKTIPLLAIGATTLFYAFKSNNVIDQGYTITELRALYSSGDQSKWPKPTVDESVLKDGFEDIGTLGEVPFPKDNPYSKEKIRTRKSLIF